jgi:hypothetical protein
MWEANPFADGRRDTDNSAKGFAPHRSNGSGASRDCAAAAMG